MKLIGYVTYGIYMGCTLWLLFTAIMQVHLYRLSKKIKYRKPGLFKGELPLITIQLPIYNEKYVIEGLLRSIAALQYPKNRFEILVLDDSTDDTSMIIDNVVLALQKQQVNISVIRRVARTGYKAAALQDALSCCKGELIAVFDADFRPSADFLQQLLPHFNDPVVGLVQACWTHNNTTQNFLTRIQSYLLDMHFKVEQAGRFNAGYFVNFSGTAGIWRKQCIIDAGGWDSTVLSEDLDLSYRAQLKGWKIVFDSEVEVPAQLPAVMEAFKIQQFRWTKGIAQVARKTLREISAMFLPARKKLHSYFHLLSSFSFVFIFVSAILSLPLLLLRNAYPEFIQLTHYTVIAVLNLVATAFIYYRSAYETGSKLRDFLIYYPLFLVVYLAMSVQNSIAVLQGVAGIRSPFIRTPKAGDEPMRHGYAEKKINWMTYVEMGVLMYFCISIYLSFFLNDYFLLPFFIMFSSGLIILLYQGLKPFLHEKQTANGYKRRGVSSAFANLQKSE